MDSYELLLILFQILIQIVSVPEFTVSECTDYCLTKYGVRADCC